MQLFNNNKHTVAKTLLSVFCLW